MKSLTRDQLASGEWVWDDALQEFVHKDSIQETTTTETEEEEVKTTERKVIGRWTGNKFV